MSKEIKEKGMTLRLPASVMDALRVEAEKNTRTMAAQVLHILKAHLAKNHD